MTRGNAGARPGAPMPGRAARLLRYEEARLARVEAQVSALAGRVQIAKQDVLDADEVYGREGTPENAAYLAAVVAQHRTIRAQLAAVQRRRINSVGGDRADAHDAGSIVRLTFA